MTTLFKAPQIGEPRSTGVKNGGVTSYDTRIIAPTSRIVGAGGGLGVGLVSDARDSGR